MIWNWLQILFCGVSSENLDKSFLNLLFPENEDDDDAEGDGNEGEEGEGASSDDMNDVDSDAELTPGNTSDEEYERKSNLKAQTLEILNSVIQKKWKQ